jgi:hypothetical protein
LAVAAMAALLRALRAFSRRFRRRRISLMRSITLPPVAASGAALLPQNGLF